MCRKNERETKKWILKISNWNNLFQLNDKQFGTYKNLNLQTKKSGKNYINLLFCARDMCFN